MTAGLRGPLCAPLQGYRNPQGRAAHTGSPGSRSRRRFQPVPTEGKVWELLFQLRGTGKYSREWRRRGQNCLFFRGSYESESFSGNTGARAPGAC